MPRSHLTVASLSRIKSPAEGQVDYFDARCPGLSFRASYGGGRTWVYFHRWQGKKRRLRLGTYPALGLAEAREAWIEYEPCPQFAWRMGLLKTANTRQLMTPPEMQQFVDISMASAYIGMTMQRANGKTECYYRCNGKHGTRGIYGEKGLRCPSKAINGDYLEKTIWADIESFLQNPGSLIEQLKARFRQLDIWMITYPIEVI
jgi:hypothetical protein